MIDFLGIIEFIGAMAGLFHALAVGVKAACEEWQKWQQYKKGEV